MTCINTKKELEIAISKLEGFRNPKPNLEQYLTPDEIVSEMVFLAYMHGNIKNKIVIDLCTGTGKIALASSLLRPKIVIGLEIDREALKIALKNRETLNAKNVFFVLADATQLPVKNGKFIVLQNPPFGIISSLHKDVDFIRSASYIAEWMYSIHKGGNEKTRNFLKKVYNKLNFDVILIKKFSFTIPRQFYFHKKPKQKIDVDLYVAKKI